MVDGAHFITGLEWTQYNGVCYPQFSPVFRASKGSNDLEHTVELQWLEH